MKSKSASRNGRAVTTRRGAPVEAAQNGFLVVAIGASAGGIEAFGEFMRSLPTNTGMAFVIIQHLDPKHHSILTELLSRETKMPVKEAKDGMGVEPNHVFVIPPNATMSIAARRLHVTSPREETRGPHMSIDHFMRTLAHEERERAVGVILSGTGSDGTLGMAEIQAQGGVTFAQDVSSAKYDGMPRSVIASGCVDYVLSPKKIARELERISRHPYVVAAPEVSDARVGEQASLNSIFQVLRRNTGVDFTKYRKTTILRRIQRRMVVHRLQGLDEYVKYLQTNLNEIKALYRDMLINVTSFFRNPRVFDTLKSEVFPTIFRNRTSAAPIRIWTPGCASGEETYSIAIALLEFLGDKEPQIPIQLFGTDVSETSIDKARAGTYPENIQTDVSPERLRRFFTKATAGHRISKNIRDVCIFAQHNLLSDPPFSQIDLICCRNVLIYLEPIVQNKVLSLFHYALRPDGFLVLGTSEGLGGAANLFTAEDRTYKIFAKKSSAMREVLTFSLNPQRDRTEYGPIHVPTKRPEATSNYLEAQKGFDRRLLSQYAPATVFVNEDLEIIHSRGDVNRYLKLAPGRASLSILKMAKQGLVLDLRNALARAKKDNRPVRKQNVQVKSGGNGEGTVNADATRLVSFEVVPIRLGNLKELYFMVLFQDVLLEAEPKASRRGAKQRRESKHGPLTIKLEQELAATKEYLQSVIETQEATNEELQSANEEILSSNEELQSTNEELETAKEELQSANEELNTVNDELRSRNLEITQVNNDLTNLLASIDITVVMVGSDLTIRRFTPLAHEVLGLIPTDVGRPLLNINPNTEISDLQQMVVKVMSTFRPVEKEIVDQKGGRFQLRILPYRTTDNKIDGAVITLVDISPKTAVQ
jgi:two-component system, chemotaxis family, CheB/CheR fusion protein